MSDVLFRPATADDVGTVLSLFAEHDVLEFGRVEMEHDEVLEVLEDDGLAWLALSDDGQPAGFAHVQRNGVCDSAALDPELRTELVRRVLAGAAELGVSRLEHWGGAVGTLTATALQPFGFTHTVTSWNLSRRLLDLTPPTWPDAVEVRPFDPGQVEQVWTLVTRAFAGTGFSRDRTLEEWRRQVLRDADVVCAWEGDVLVGCATHEVRFGEGFIGQLAVDPSRRGLGLGEALLLEAFARDLDQGRSSTKLNVDGTNDSARRLYDKVGMVVEQEYRKWEKQL